MKKKRNQLGINGKNRALEFFSWKNKINEFLEIIN